MERNAAMAITLRVGFSGGLGCNHGRCYSCELQVARGTIARVTSRGESLPFWSQLAQFGYGSAESTEFDVVKHSSIAEQ